MGKDLCGRFEARVNGEWIPISSHEDWTRGALGNWLDGVNDFNFKNPRGLPLDLEGKRNDGIGGWKSSWLHVDEILAAVPPLDLTRVRLDIELYQIACEHPEPIAELISILPAGLWDTAIRNNWRLTTVSKIFGTEANDGTMEFIVEHDTSREEGFEELIAEARRIKATYGDARFVYGFE